MKEKKKNCFIIIYIMKFEYKDEREEKELKKEWRKNT